MPLSHMHSPDTVGLSLHWPWPWMRVHGSPEPLAGRMHSIAGSIEMRRYVAILASHELYRHAFGWPDEIPDPFGTRDVAGVDA